jgi:predicted dehydrogenase
MKPLKIGIAGYGVVGKRRRRCIDNNCNLKLVAVCDQTFSKDGQMPDGLRYYQSFKKLITEDLDALFVCLTNDVAPIVTIEALKKGMHVFCEKPPGRNVDDIKKVIEVEKLNPSLKLMYGFNHRYHDSVQDALNIINSGELGKIINLRGVYGKSKLITFNQPNWRTKRDIAGGGVLLDQGIHMVDLMCLFSGKFEEVNSFISNNRWNYDVEDNAYVIMRTGDGVVAMLNSSATQWRHRFNLDICLEKGSLILGGILSGSKSYGAETLTVVYADPDKDNGDPREHVTLYNKDRSWDDEVQVFTECILLNNAVTSGTSLDALNTMDLVFRIYNSDKKWKKYID